MLSFAFVIVPVRNHICSVDSIVGKNCPEQYSELAKVDDVDSSAGLNAARKLIASLYDLKKKFVSCHENLNKLRVQLATCKDTSLVRLSSSEPSLHQYVLRTSFFVIVTTLRQMRQMPHTEIDEFFLYKDFI